VAPGGRPSPRQAHTLAGELSSPASRIHLGEKAAARTGNGALVIARAINILT
jgi:hypothetical protein